MRVGSKVDCLVCLFRVGVGVVELRYVVQVRFTRVLKYKYWFVQYLFLKLCSFLLFTTNKTLSQMLATNLINQV